MARDMDCRQDGNASALNTLIRTTTAMVLVSRRRPIRQSSRPTGEGPADRRLQVPSITMGVCYYGLLDLFFSFGSRGDRMLYAGIAAIISVRPRARGGWQEADPPQCGRLPRARAAPVPTA